jgi:hypothetical protein
VHPSVRFSVPRFERTRRTRMPSRAGPGPRSKAPSRGLACGPSPADPGPAHPSGTRGRPLGPRPVLTWMRAHVRSPAGAPGRGFVGGSRRVHRGTQPVRRRGLLPPYPPAPFPFFTTPFPRPASVRSEPRLFCSPRLAIQLSLSLPLPVSPCLSLSFSVSHTLSISPSASPSPLLPLRLPFCLSVSPSASPCPPSAQPVFIFCSPLPH